MVTWLEIAKLRGIRQGRLDEFCPLTVLVGSNGSGKSTVLDALLIGVSPRPGEAIGRAVSRRWEQTPVGEWLFYRRGGKAEVRVGVGERDRVTRLSWRDGAFASTLNLIAPGPLRVNGPAPVGAIEAVVTTDGSSTPRAKPVVGLFERNAYTALENIEDRAALTNGWPSPRLVDMRGVEFGARTMPEVYSRAVEEGRAEAAIDLLRALVPGMKTLQILVEEGEPVLHLVNGAGSTPLAMAGDGVRGVARLALELASHKDGLVLVEEPEVHQHPRALKQTARAMRAALGQGLQLVVTTHSLDLIDNLVAELDSGGQLEQVAVFHLQLEDGQLRSTRYPGDEVRRARQNLEMELR